MKQLEQATIITHDQIDPTIYAMVLKAPQIAASARPGQFVMVYLNKGAHLLPRPISLCDADKTTGTITLVYVTVGAGTQIMSRWPSGHAVQLLGPLGNGFTFDHLPANSSKTAALAGGGLGVPPLLFLLKQLTQAGITADVYLGFKEKSARADYFTPITPRLHIATDDGSAGHKGTVIDLIKNTSAIYSTIFSCGPIQMLKALSSYAHDNNTLCQISVEERMACGIGACKGCVVKTFVGYKLCCADGPVFDSCQIVAQNDVQRPSRLL